MKISLIFTAFVAAVASVVLPSDVDGLTPANNGIVGPPPPIHHPYDTSVETLDQADTRNTNVPEPCMFCAIKVQNCIKRNNGTSPDPEKDCILSVCAKNLFCGQNHCFPSDVYPELHDSSKERRSGEPISAVEAPNPFGKREGACDHCKRAIVDCLHSHRGNERYCEFRACQTHPDCGEQYGCISWRACQVGRDTALLKLRRSNDVEATTPAIESGLATDDIDPKIESNSPACKQCLQKVAECDAKGDKTPGQHVRCAMEVCRANQVCQENQCFPRQWCPHHSPEPHSDEDEAPTLATDISARTLAEDNDSSDLQRYPPGQEPHGCGDCQRIVDDCVDAMGRLVRKEQRCNEWICGEYPLCRVNACLPSGWCPVNPSK